MKFNINSIEELNIIVVIPKSLPKFIPLPKLNKTDRYVLIEDIICSFAEEIFTDYKLISSVQFKIIRDSDIEIDDEAEDLVRYFEKALEKKKKRKYC